MVETSSTGVKRTLKKIGISKSTFYEWYQKYLEDGFDGLKSKSKCPKQFWNRIPDSERQKIVEYALDHPQLSCREVAFEITDKRLYFVSESSVYRILKAAGLVTSPAYAIQTAKDEYEHKTTRINEMWQTDFTYFKIICWGWYYLSTVLDDYSRKIIAWKLCTSMTAEDVKETLNLAIEITGVNDAKIIQKTRLLSDNGPCYISGELKDYVENQNMLHSRGRPFHPQTQGKIERYHRSMKNVILLDNYYTPSELENRISQWVDYYNNYRYHESINNITPSNKYNGLENKILKKRREVKEKTLKQRKVWNKKTLFASGKLTLSHV